jgi:hypothetical protein
VPCGRRDAICTMARLFGIDSRLRGHDGIGIFFQVVCQN